MRKKGIVVLSWMMFLCSMLLSMCAYAHTQQNPMHSANVAMQYANHSLTITNKSNQPINLQHALLSFIYAGNITSIRVTDNTMLKSTISMQDFSKQPNSAGNYFTIRFDDIMPSLLLKGQSLTLFLAMDEKEIPHGFQLLTVDRVPVQVQVTVANANWTQTISVCNNSPNSIPLKDIEFDFNYSLPMPSSIWGSPWVAWHVGSQQGSQVVLLGGTEWASPLTSDPNCTHPLTIQFSSTPTSPVPTGPFVFKSAGGTSSTFGSLTITMQNQPASGVSTPTVTVSGMGSTSQQIVNWGAQWKLTNLVPGSYKITSSTVDNGQQFYKADPITVNVNGNATSLATVTYVSVPTGQVTVSLINPPDSQEPVTLIGQTYSFNKTVSNNTSLTLPTDTYNVSSIVPGYTAVISPNPLIVPNNTSLTVSYQKQTAIPRFVGYFQSWTSDPQTTDGTKTNLANLPSYVNVVNLSFIKPDAVYQKGSMTISGTGLEFNYQSGAVLKQAVATLHQKQPNTKVLVAIGGATYTNWGSLNAKAIADFVTDFGLDGVDIDYEPSSTGCALGSDNLIHCQIDSAFQGFVQSLRSVLPRPYWITVTGWSVACYGQDQWKNATPSSQFTGMLLPLLRSAAAKDIDLVNAMSYDAGPTYDPIQALDAYSNYFAGPVAMGIEVPPEGWGGHVYTMTEVNQLIQAVNAKAPQHNTPPGMMLWSIQKKPNGTPSSTNPSAQMMATAVCTGLGLANCNQPMLING